MNNATNTKKTYITRDEFPIEFCSSMRNFSMFSIFFLVLKNIASWQYENIIRNEKGGVSRVSTISPIAWHNDI